MDMDLTPQQKDARAAYHAFVDQHIVPHADRFDLEERIPTELISAMAKEGYLGAVVPEAFGGSPIDMISYGLLAEELGRGSSSVNALLTVHSMCSFAIARWGTTEQKERWLSRMAQGQMIGAFALTEVHAGSDAKSVETEAVPTADGYVLNGRKRWITFGQIANLFLVFGKCEGQLMIFFVERSNPGVSVVPISGMLGSRASMLGEVRLENCHIAKEDVIARAGFGFASVLASVLDIGRYTVACNCVGIGQACLDASLAYTSTRKQFGVLLKEHQLIQQMIANMLTNLNAARLLTQRAGYLKEINDPRMIMETMIAKYFASTMANKAANDAVQIHGANGVSSDYPVQRFLRDARIQEIIEGSSQIQQMTIAKYSYQQ
ncbi:MAG: acyl-CoA dehydrogenase family protein [Chloroflexi bacterium]|nr:acyl-CoA dehydrogenase family protein [Chloroflexota bacterium]